MPTYDTPQPPKSQAPGSGPEPVELYSKYMLRTPLEINFVLRSMLNRSCMATAYFNQGRSFFLTWILGISTDDKNLVLDASSDTVINREALQASRITITASLDHVKIQFAVSNLHATSFEGRPALLAPVPETLLRLQRREYFRLETSIAAPVRCYIPGPEELDAPLELALLDLSGGGLSLKAPTTIAGFFKEGTLYRNCRLQIPDEPVLVTDLCVRNSFSVTHKEGYEYLRVGCEFVKLPGAKLSMIQRYITRTERLRKAKLTGMA